MVIPLGSFSESTHTATATKGSSNSEFTLTFAPSDPVVNAEQLQERAYVLAVAVDNPGFTRQ